MQKTVLHIGYIISLALFQLGPAYTRAQVAYGRYTEYKPVTQQYVDSILYPIEENKKEAQLVEDSLREHIIPPLRQKIWSVADVANNKWTKQVLIDSVNRLCDKILDSLMTSRQLICISGVYTNEEANINEATVERVVFTAANSGMVGLYSDRVELIGTLDKVIYSLDNVNIAGINPKTKIGNDVTAVYLTLNKHKHYLPIISYDKGKEFDKALATPSQSAQVYGMIITAIKGNNVTPLLVIDNIVVAKK